MEKVFKNIILLIALCYLLCSCDKRIVPPEDTGRVTTIGDTSYVEIMPPWSGFETPYDIIVGNDQLIYVADYSKNEILMLDAAGRILKKRNILHPISIAQNSKLDLYIGGETISMEGDTIGAIYKINLVQWDTTYYDTLISSVGTDSIVPRHVTTRYDHKLDEAHMRIIFQEPERPGRKYTGIGVLPNNEFLVARVGSDSLGNSSFVDPDTRVLHFNKNDIFITPRTELLTRPSGGTYITDIRNLTHLLVYKSSYNIVLTQSIEGVKYGAIYLVFQKTADGDFWVPGFDPAKHDVDFLKGYQFKEASAATYNYYRSELFIIDAALDSVFIFDRKGNFKKESFGKHKTTYDNPYFPGIKNPRGIAYSNDCTLYIADTGNKIIRRFRLSSQTRCY